MKIIVTSHGNLCEGILNSYEMLVGKNDSIAAISLKENDTGEFEREITNIIKSTKGDILVLCDIYGGTPYNIAYYLYLEQSDRIRVVSGINLPMLLETGLSLSNSISLDSIVNVAINSGADSIKKADEINLEKEMNSEEDIF